MKCKYCNSSGTNGATCPLNPTTKNSRPDKHPNAVLVMSNYADVSYDLQPPAVRNAIYAQHHLHPGKKPTFATMSKKECNAAYAQHLLQHAHAIQVKPKSKKACNATYAQHILQHAIQVKPKSKKKLKPLPKSSPKPSPKPLPKSAPKPLPPKPSQKVTFAKFHNIALKVDSKYKENENRIREKYDNKERFMKVLSKIKGINDGDIVFTGKRESDTFFGGFYVYYSQGFKPDSPPTLRGGDETGWDTLVSIGSFFNRPQGNKYKENFRIKYKHIKYRDAVLEIIADYPKGEYFNSIAHFFQGGAEEPDEYLDMLKHYNIWD